MKKKRSGMAVMVVLFFAFAIGIIMFFMVRSSSNLGFQTKQTLYEMQAYYLAQSAMQYAKLHITLLPKEIYDYYGNGANTGNALDKIDSDLLPPMAMTAFYDQTSKYDLYNESTSTDLVFPYAGRFYVENLEYLLSSDDMKMVQDSYRVKVHSEISHGKDKKHNDELEEEFVVSRYTGR